MRGNFTRRVIRIWLTGRLRSRIGNAYAGYALRRLRCSQAFFVFLKLREQVDRQNENSVGGEQRKPVEVSEKGQGYPSGDAHGPHYNKLFR